jgi:hypothetical protein
LRGLCCETNETKLLSVDAAVNHFEARHPYELARAGYAECVCRETGFRARDKGTGTPSQIRLPLCRDGVSTKKAAESGLFAGVFRLCDLPAV